jgi:kynurenine formamidase
MPLPFDSLIDLTHTLTPDIPGWDGDCCFRLHTAVDYADCSAPNLFRVQKMECKAGVGTHIDAPAHCIPGGKTIHEITLQELVLPCAVIKIADADEHFTLLPEHVHTYEEKHREIKEGSFVIVHTGWDRFWNDAKKYRNDLQFPSIGEESAKLLLSRGISGIGIDTLSPDAVGKDFPVHRLLLGAGKIIVENVANAGSLPEAGATIMIMPMKIGQGTEAPVRLSAMVQK